MTSIVVVDKSASIKSIKTKDLTRETIYKKCGFRKSDGFEMRNKFVIKKFGIETVEVWSRDSGKAGTENKYELPPPIDSALYFGSLAIVGFNKKDEMIDLTDETWKKIYEHLFGGFEDIDNPDSEAEYSEDELDSVPDEKKTKHGYLKDGFVVDGNEVESEDELESDDDDDDDEDESEEESEGDIISGEEEDLTGGSELELEEEEYYYSDDN